MNIKESIQQIETLIEAWQLDEADLNQTDINAMQVLLKENQELNQKYLNAVADYETTMFEKEQLNSLVNSCQEEIRELKKQLEEYKDKISWYENFEVNKTIDKLRLKHNVQQKEFINYLEDEIKSSSALDTINKQTAMYIHSTTLKKYKEIIGDKQ